jgi:hypothetical protein
MPELTRRRVSSRVPIWLIFSVKPGRCTLAALEAWAASHDVSRSEAIRQLVELGLKAKK